MLGDKLQAVIAKFGGERRLTEESIAEAISEVRLALLDADVAYRIVKSLIKRIKEKAVGQKLIKGVTAGQQFIKVVHDEIAAFMGEEEPALDLEKKPSVILLCGLQGSGKTTHAAKLARYLKKERSVMLAACDLQRPAAVAQLKILADKISVPLFSGSGSDPVAVAAAARRHAEREGIEVLIVDTAGRISLDKPLMEELKAIKKAVDPNEVLFVANAATGQEAVEVAAAFDRELSITGSILTMLDGTTRGGAALSILEVTGKPLKFEGIGERLDDFQLFNPKSMADRMLGMGDAVNLVRRAQEHIDEDAAKELEKKIRSATFTYEDYLKHIQVIKKMGPIKKLLQMFPGMSAEKEFDIDDKEFYKTEVMIQSMTAEERAGKCELDKSRCVRISKGSGVSLEKVYDLIKMFKKARRFFKNVPSMKQLEKMMGGGMSWR